MQLSKRLSAVAEFVTPGGCLVDVGTDHGYVPIALLEQKKISSAIAMDVNRGPLERAREHIAQYQMGDYIETRLSDGLHALRAGEGDSLLIAGMGGGLTIRILSEGEPLLSGFRELILEPQSDIDRVRAWLLEHGFFLAQENFVEEDGKYYPILRAVPGEKENLKAEELFYGPRLLEKENPEDREFVVPAKLKELIEKKDYGRYALPNGDMPVCFLSTNDITGGNSGSPVLNENGELIGCAFDGNWESLSGDINFDNNLQRCIALDIRYVLFILEKLGGCGHLIKEMNIIE